MLLAFLFLSQSVCWSSVCRSSVLVSVCVCVFVCVSVCLCGRTFQVYPCIVLPVLLFLLLPPIATRLLTSQLLVLALVSAQFSETTTPSIRKSYLFSTLRRRNASDASLIWIFGRLQSGKKYKNLYNGQTGDNLRQ